MSPLRTLARPLLASIFVVGGAAALKEPGGRVETVRAAGLDQPERLVRVNAATQVVAGLALATGRLPRIAAAVLAGSLVPTTVVGHGFWSVPPERRQSEQIQFLKNVGLLGGLLLAVADTGGRESVPHAVSRAARRAARRAERSTQRAATRAAAALPHA